MASFPLLLQDLNLIVREVIMGHIIFMQNSRRLEQGLHSLDTILQ
jgi:hypothetical protein